MKAHSASCCHGARSSSPDPWPSRRRGARSAAFGVVFAVLAALVPKCPVCIAAWLGVIGLSGLAARLDARALGFAAALIAALAAAAFGAAIVHRFSGRNVEKITNTTEGDGT